jgi:hypothetical protein
VSSRTSARGMSRRPSSEKPFTAQLNHKSIEQRAFRLEPSTTILTNQFLWPLRFLSSPRSGFARHFVLVSKRNQLFLASCKSRRRSNFHVRFFSRALWSDCSFTASSCLDVPLFSPSTSALVSMTQHARARAELSLMLVTRPARMEIQ